MSKIIAVCGSPESGKTTFALKLAHSLNNKGKKKVLTKEGVVESAYPNVFTVKF